MHGKKGDDISLLYVGELSTVTDYYLLCTVDSEPQMWAIVDAVETVLAKKRSKLFGIEGVKGAMWVLLDCGDVIVHIFRQESRRFYNLDGLWADAPKIDLKGNFIPTLITAPKGVTTPASVTTPAGGKPDAIRKRKAL